MKSCLWVKAFSIIFEQNNRLQLEKERLLSKQSARKFQFIFSSSMLIQLIKTVRGYAVAAMLSPLHYGLIQSLAIFQTYLPILQGGYNQGVERELPGHLEEGRKDIVTKVFSNGMIWASISGLIASGIYLGIMLWSKKSPDALFIWCFYLPIVLTLPMSGFLEMFYVAQGKIKQLSIIRTIASLVFTALIVLVFYFDFKGQVISLSIQYIALCFLLWFTTKERIRVGQFSFRFVFMHIKKGVMVLVTHYLFFILLSLDRIYMTTVMGAEEYANYALAISFFRVGILLSESINTISYRYLNLSRISDKKMVVATEFFTMLKLAMLFFMGMATFIFGFSDDFFTYVLPKYIGAIFYARIMGISLVFSGISLLIIHYFYSIFQHKKMINLISTSIGFMCLFLLYCYFTHKDGGYVAFAFLINQIILFFMLVVAFVVENIALLKSKVIWLKILLIVFLGGLFCFNIYALQHITNFWHHVLLVVGFNALMLVVGVVIVKREKYQWNG